jgi:hypothetical protein
LHGIAAASTVIAAGVRPRSRKNWKNYYDLNDGISFGERFARPHDSNSMIVKRVVHVGQVDARHVTRAAVLRANAASSAGMIFCGLRAGCGDAASQALLIVALGGLRKRLVGIVARDACDSRIAIAPAFAAHQPLRL